MKVLKASPRFVIQSDTEIGEHRRLLDSSGFPWEVVSKAPLTIRPLRKGYPRKIVELHPYKEYVAQAKLRRLVDYMSNIEALDLGISHIFLDAPDVLKKMRGWPNMYQVSKGSDVGHVVFRSISIQWGPLPLSPMKKPSPWPFPAETPNVRLVPERGLLRVFTKDRPDRYRVLPVCDAIQFATLVEDSGWPQDGYDHRLRHVAR